MTEQVIAGRSPFRQPHQDNLAHKPNIVRDSYNNRQTTIMSNKNLTNLAQSDPLLPQDPPPTKPNGGLKDAFGKPIPVSNPKALEETLAQVSSGDKPPSALDQFFSDRAEQKLTEIIAPATDAPIKSIGDEKAEPPPTHWSTDPAKYPQFQARIADMYKQFDVSEDSSLPTADTWVLRVANVKTLPEYKGTGKQLLEALLQNGIDLIRADINRMIEDANRDHKLNLDPDKIIEQLFGNLEKVARDGLTADQMIAQVSMCIASSRQNQEIVAMNVATSKAHEQKAVVIAPNTTGDPSLDVLFVKANILQKSGLMPKGVDTVEKIVTIGMMGQVLGLDLITAINMIDVISGKPTLKPQLMIALARRAGLLEMLDIKDDGKTCTVTVKRKGEAEYSSSFGMADADLITTVEWKDNVKKTIKLSEKDNWVKQPKVMRQWRCVAAVWRVVFPDVVWGMSYTADELESSEDASITDPKAMIEATAA